MSRSILQGSAAAQLSCFQLRTRRTCIMAKDEAHLRPGLQQIDFELSCFRVSNRLFLQLAFSGLAVFNPPGGFQQACLPGLSSRRVNNAGIWRDWHRTLGSNTWVCANAG